MRCRRCLRTVIREVGASFCRMCEHRHAAFVDLVREVEEARLHPCRQCGADYFDSQRPTFCSDACADRHRAEDALAMAEAAREQLDLRTATGWLHRLFRYLERRDGDECYLCERPIKLKSVGPSGPSVDHLIPRSKGGTHDLANLALVHRRCNSAKGNRAANEQLRIIG